MDGYILAIDPGNIESGWCILEAGTLRPVNFDKSVNHLVLPLLTRKHDLFPLSAVVIERVMSYGMAVGRDVFETCEWIGRFTQRARDRRIPVYYVFRGEEKLHICHDSRAKDSNIRRALIDRFADHDLTNGKGTKKDPDWFYGFRTDIWMAYAVGLTFLETHDKPLTKQQARSD